MAENIGRQISLLRAWIPLPASNASGFIPGMPNFMFLLAADCRSRWLLVPHKGTGRRSRSVPAMKTAEDAASPDQINLGEVADNGILCPFSLDTG